MIEVALSRIRDAVAVDDGAQARNVGLMVVGVALVVRLIVVFALPVVEWNTPDTRIYLAQARALLEGGFVEFFPNGYPLLVALVWSVPGLDGSHVALQMVSVVFSTAIVGLVFQIAYRWRQNWVIAAAAALLIAFWPNHVRYVPRLLSDLPATCLLVGGVACLLSRRWLAAGLLVGAAVTMRSTFLPLWLGFCILLSYQGSRRASLLVLAGGAAPIGMILALAYARTGNLSLGGNLAYNLFKSVGIYRADLHFSDSPLPPDAVWEGLRAYLAVLIEKPHEFIAQRLQAMWDLWGPWMDDEGRSWLSRLVIGWRLPLLALGLGGFSRCWRQPTVWVLMLPTLLLTAIHVVFFGRPRFILPAEPFLAVLAAAWVWDVVSARINKA